MKDSLLNAKVQLDLESSEIWYEIESGEYAGIWVSKSEEKEATYASSEDIYTWSAKKGDCTVKGEYSLQAAIWALQTKLNVRNHWD